MIIEDCEGSTTSNNAQRDVISYELVVTVLACMNNNK